MSEKRIVVDDNDGADLSGVNEHLHVVISRRTPSGDVLVGEFDFADYASLSTWASLSKDAGPVPKIP